jgi:hypothetical protein
MRNGLGRELTEDDVYRYLARARQLTGLSSEEFYRAVIELSDEDFQHLAQGYRNCGEVLERVRLKVNQLGWSFDSLARLPAVEMRNGR